MEPMTYLWRDRRRRLGLPLSFTRYRLSRDRIFCEKGFLNLKVAIMPSLVTPLAVLPSLACSQNVVSSPVSRSSSVTAPKSPAAYLPLADTDDSGASMEAGFSPVIFAAGFVCALAVSVAIAIEMSKRCFFIS